MVPPSPLLSPDDIVRGLCRHPKNHTTPVSPYLSYKPSFLHFQQTSLPQTTLTISLVPMKCSPPLGNIN